jgi:hypothetical protein
MIDEARGESKPATHVAGQTCLTDQVVSLMYHRDDATGTIIPATDVMATDVVATDDIATDVVATDVVATDVVARCCCHRCCCQDVESSISIKYMHPPAYIIILQLTWSSSSLHHPSPAYIILKD